MHGSYASSCDQTSTPRCRKGGWTGTGETGSVRRRGTPAGSCKVVGDDALAHGQRVYDGWLRPGRCKHLRATSRHMEALSRQECLPERIRKSSCTCSQAAAVAVDEVGAQNFRWCGCSPGPCASNEPLLGLSRPPPTAQQPSRCFSERDPTYCRVPYATQLRG